MIKWLFCLLWWASAAVAQPRIPLWDQLETLPDAQGAHSPASAAAAFDAGQGGKLPYADFAYGKWIPYPYWAKFSLHNPTQETQSRLLAYELPTQDSSALWQATPDKGWQPFAQIDAVSTVSADRIGTGQLYPVWRVWLKPGETQVFLLRLDGYNLMRFPLFLLEDDAFAVQQRSLFLGLGFVLAIPLVVLLYVLTLIRIAEDKSLPIFIVMAIAEMLGAAWVSGLLHAIFPWIDRWTAGWLGWAGYVLLLGLSALHARVFMNTPVADKRADLALQALAAAWLLVLPAFTIIKPEAARLCLLLGGTVHALILTWLSLRCHARLPLQETRSHMALFVAVWVIYAGSGLLYIAYRIAHLPVYVTLISNFVQGSLVAALLGCAVSVQIIRQRRTMQASVQRHQERNHLYAAAHHDLWQPIQSVGLYAAALTNSVANTVTDHNAQHQRYLQGIESAVNSVHDFMDELRQVDLAPHIQTVELHELLAPLVEEYRHIASHKHISLRYRAPRLTVQTDSALLQRIVRNLLSNAIRYTNKGGRILLGCRRKGQPQHGAHWLMVYDNGVGMSDAEAQRCFEMFARGDDVGRIPEGMGIGLYSVKRIAQQLNAQTRLVSRLNVGTAIGVSLA
jgi:signal transduction histidine kinase